MVEGRTVSAALIQTPTFASVTLSNFKLAGSASAFVLETAMSSVKV